MADARSDEELMSAYGTGEMRAFEELYERHRGPLFRFFLRGLKQRAVAEELFQECWSRIIVARERYRPDARFRTYLMQIAHNLLVDHYRRDRPAVAGAAGEREIESYEAPESARPDTVLSEFEQARRMERALESLPEDQRSAFLMRVEQEMGVDEIASAAGVGHETAKSRLRYAFAKLKAAADG
jgi:RNA polymerase sigma-70 factor (ECF subfamily)